MNGDDGAQSMVGEASLSLATACYGNKMSGNMGHDEDDVLYIAFKGKEAVPGANGAKWNAGSFDEFHSSIQGLGHRLVAKIGGGTGKSDVGTNGTSPAPTSKETGMRTSRTGRQRAKATTSAARKNHHD